MKEREPNAKQGVTPKAPVRKKKLIEQTKIDALKNDVDLVTLIQSRGIVLKQNGNSYKGLCPFHDDNKSPSLSVTPSKNLFKCFGCGKAGDQIKFIQLMDQVDFPTAVATLLEQSTSVRSEPEPAPSELPPEKARQLLERVVAVYSSNLENIIVSKQYLEDRGVLDNGLLDHHRAGFSSGSLIDILPSQGGILQDLTTLGIIDHQGRERFIGCIVFPVNDIEGNILTLYGRSIKDGSKRHLFLPNRPTGLWNIRIIKYYEVIILVESIIDALSVVLAGFPNVAAIQGINGLTDDHVKQLKENGVKAITLLMDGDEPGQNSCLRLKEKMADFQVRELTLPDNHDPNSYLVAHGPESLSNFIRTAPDTSKKVSSLTAAKTGQLQRNGDGFTLTYGLRHYQIIGLDKGRRKLKATVRLEHGGKLHVDTIDFYSARARRTLAQDICRRFDEIPETIEADITRLMTACEQAHEEEVIENSPQAEIVEISAQEKKEAEAFGKSADLISTILADFETCGLIGEESNKLLGYLAMTSRKLDKPLSMLILSSSGAGKSALQDAITGFCPPEDLIKITSLSSKALFYKEQQSLKNKVLAIEEGDGADDSAYAIRSLISNGVLISETTIKDLGTGRLTTMESRVEGPTSVFFTTTKPNTDPETASRFFVTGIDESREQTRKILTFQRLQQMVDNTSNSCRADAIRNLHRNFQRLLQPVGVRNPYGDKLDYDDDRLQGRRDQPKYLQLIKTIAFLRQMQKKVWEGGYVEVDKEDIRIANYLANELMGKSLGELSRPGLDLLMILDQMVEHMGAELDEEEVNSAATPFTRRQVREFSGWSNYRVHTHMKELIDLEYVLIDSGRNGVSYRYRLAYEGQGKAGDKFMLGLTDVEDLDEK